YAGNNIVEQIAIENNISQEHVRRLLSGCEDSSNYELDIGSSLGSVCDKLISDISGTLRYYAAQEKSAIFEKIYICGGFALVDGFVELLNGKLPAPAVLWNPFDKMSCDANLVRRDIVQERGPALAVAAGLAMRSV
ncbi:unnamed protein product, partial [marine sediment metagenome]